MIDTGMLTAHEKLELIASLLVSLNAEIVDVAHDPAELAHLLDGPINEEEAKELAEALTQTCNAFDIFAELMRQSCECSNDRFPGIRWPASPDGYNDLSYVEKCDACTRFESDEAAAKHLAAHYSVRWGYARRDAHPKTDADFRWEPVKNDGLDYTGWSAFIDRPERDG